MTLTTRVDGAARLAHTAHQAATAVGDLTAVNQAAGDLVVGASKIPRRTGALAATAHAEADAVGFTLVAGGSEAPYAGFVYARRPFFADAVTDQVKTLADRYAAALAAAVDLLKGK